MTLTKNCPDSIYIPICESFQYCSTEIFNPTIKYIQQQRDSKSTL